MFPDTDTRMMPAHVPTCNPTLFSGLGGVSARGKRGREGVVEVVRHDAGGHIGLQGGVNMGLVRFPCFEKVVAAWRPRVAWWGGCTSYLSPTGDAETRLCDEA